MTTMLMNFFGAKNPKPQDAESIMKYFLSLGYTRNQVAGAIGNAVKRGYISVAGRQYCRSRNRKVNVFVREGEE